MKLCIGLKKTTVLLTIVLALLTISSEAFADITRICSAYYHGRVLAITPQGRHESGVGWEALRLGKMADFEGQGTCDKRKPENCRKRARDKLLACAIAHANSPGRKPQECSPNNNITSYPIKDLKRKVRQKACGPLCSKDGIHVTDLIQRPYQLKVMLEVAITGNDLCGKENPGTINIDGQNYRIDGSRRRLSQPLRIFTINCN